MNCFLGFDGGGTKTECVLMDQTGAILARAKGPPSNPTRIGFSAALAAVVQSAEVAIQSARIATHSPEIVALCAGLAGTGTSENRKRMRDLLAGHFPSALIEVRTDLDIPLSAMPAGPAMVMVVGTGSAVIGRDARGVIMRQGGHGPDASDEGSAFDIGRLAIAAARTEDSSDADHLSRQIRHHLGLSSWLEVDLKSATHADSVYPRVFPVVAAAADAGNPLAQSLLARAAEKLSALAFRLSQSLDVQFVPLVLGKTGGAVGRSNFFDSALDCELRRVLPNATVIKLELDPAALASAIALDLWRAGNKPSP